MTATLHEDIHSEPGRARDAIRNVARSLQLQCISGLFIAPDEFFGYAPRILSRQKPRFRYLHGNQLAAYLHVRVARRRENEVAYVFRHL